MNSSQTGSCSSYTKYNPSTHPCNVALIPTQHLSSQHYSALNTAKWNTCKESQYFVFAWEKVNLWAMEIKKRMNRCLLKLEDTWKIRFHSSQLCLVQWIPELSFLQRKSSPAMYQCYDNINNKQCFYNGKLSSFLGNSSARLFTSGLEK